MARRIPSDSEDARRIVRSFVDFLQNSVEVAPGVDAEGLEVAVECLNQVFDLRNQVDNEENARVSLVDALIQQPTAAPEEERDLGEGYGQFVEGLESAGFLSNEREARLAQAKTTFSETLKKYQGKCRSEVLAEAFKAQGNGAMAAKRYTEAIELYTLAISMWGNNAIYFANRAAAHTQAGNPVAAIMDCHKAIEINPRYSKAYSRLGLVYYSQGRYQEAIDWFSKALEVDPYNTSANENLQSTRQKLDEMAHSSRPAEPEIRIPGVNVTAQFGANLFTPTNDATTPEAVGVDVSEEIVDRMRNLFENEQQAPNSQQAGSTNNQGRAATGFQHRFNFGDMFGDQLQSVLQSINGQRTGQQNP